MATVGELTEELNKKKASLKTANAKARDLLEAMKGTDGELIVGGLTGGALVPVADLVVDYLVGGLDDTMRSIIIAGGAVVTVMMREDDQPLSYTDFAACGALGKVGGDLTEDLVAAAGVVADVGGVFDDLFKPAALTAGRPRPGQARVARLANRRAGFQALTPGGGGRAREARVRTMANNKSAFKF